MSAYIVLRWFLAVACASVVVFVGCLMLRKDIEWIGKHLWFLLLVIFGVAYAEEYAQKPPTPPTVRGITLQKPVATPYGVHLKWSRDDGSNSVGRTYAVEQYRGSSWHTEATVSGDTETTVEGFMIDSDRQWRIREVIDE